MSQRADQLLEEAQAVSAEDIERAWRDEIRRRVADIGVGHANLVSWDQARKRIFARE